MMQNRILVSSLILATAILGSCGNFKRSFEPPISAENDLIKLSIERIQHKKDRLHTWIIIENKTDKTLDLRYDSFFVDANGSKSPGALKAFAYRSDRGFPMPPHYVKKAHLEFLNVAFLPQVEMTLTNIRVQGEEGTSELVMPVPVDDGSRR